MTVRFENDLDWRALGSAFAIWTAHFMLAWTISSVFPGQLIVLWLTLGLTVAAIAALAILWRRRASRASISGLAIAIAGLGVVYNFLPALMA